MTDKEKRESARQFYYTWNGRGDEKSDSSSYWTDLLTNVLGMDDIANRVEFEKRVMVDGQTKFIDVFMEVCKELRMRFIALKPNDGRISGKISF